MDAPDGTPATAGSWDSLRFPSLPIPLLLFTSQGPAPGDKFALLSQFFPFLFLLFPHTPRPPLVRATPIPIHHFLAHSISAPSSILTLLPAALLRRKKSCSVLLADLTRVLSSRRVVFSPSLPSLPARSPLFHRICHQQCSENDMARLSRCAHPPPRHLASCHSCHMLL
jgi:hypothetical protein